MKKFLLYFFAFIFICFILPAILTKSDKIQANKDINEKQENKDKIEDFLDYMTTVFYNWLTKEDNIKYINIIKIIEIVKRKLKSNSNFDMSIDYLIFNIWEEINEDSNRSQV